MNTKTKTQKPAAPAEGAVRSDIRVLFMAQALPVVAKGDPVEFEPGSIEQFVSKDDPSTVLRIVSVDGELAAQVVEQE
jgi:hypothetical protein